MIIRWERGKIKVRGERLEVRGEETPKDKQAVSETNTDWKEEETPKETPILPPGDGK